MASIEKCLNGYLLIVGVHKIIISEESLISLRDQLSELDSQPENEEPEIKPKRKSPKKVTKRGALSPGKWSRKYEKCIDCGTTDRIHRSGGRCSKCYSPKLAKEDRINVDTDSTEEGFTKFKCKGCVRRCKIKTDIPVDDIKNNLGRLQKIKASTIEYCDKKLG